MATQPFTPTVSATVQAGVAQIEATIGGQGHLLRFANAGPGNVWIQFFEPTQLPPQVSLANGMLILAGAIELFSVQSDVTMVAVLGDAEGGMLNVSRGQGA